MFRSICASSQSGRCQASVRGLASVKWIRREGFAAKINEVMSILWMWMMRCERSVWTLGLDSENSETAETGLMTPKLSKARDFLFWSLHSRRPDLSLVGAFRCVFNMFRSSSFDEPWWDRMKPLHANHCYWLPKQNEKAKKWRWWGSNLVMKIAAQVCMRKFSSEEALRRWVAVGMHLIVLDVLVLYIYLVFF